MINDFEYKSLDVLPQAYPNTMSYSEQLNFVVAKIEEIINTYNQLETTTLSSIDKFNAISPKLIELENEIELMKKGFYIEDGTIEFKKFSESCKQLIADFTVNTIDTISTFVTFGLDDSGNFVAYVPQRWNDLQFSTNDENRLVIEY